MLKAYKKTHKWYPLLIAKPEMVKIEFPLLQFYHQLASHFPCSSINWPSHPTCPCLKHWRVFFKKSFLFPLSVGPVIFAKYVLYFFASTKDRYYPNLSWGLAPVMVLLGTEAVTWHFKAQIKLCYLMKTF